MTATLIAVGHLCAGLATSWLIRSGEYFLAAVLVMGMVEYWVQDLLDRRRKVTAHEEAQARLVDAATAGLIRNGVPPEDAERRAREMWGRAARTETEDQP